MLKYLLSLSDIGKVVFDKPLSELSTIKIGGIADAVVFPQTLNQLVNILLTANTNGVPHLVVGNASNVLFSDNGFRGIVVRLTEPLSQTRIENNIVTCSCALSTRVLSRQTFKHGLSGLQHFYLLPATVGGAIVMNASCFGFGTDKVLKSVTVVDKRGKLEKLDKSRLEFSYRHSLLQDQPLIAVEAEFELFATNENPLEQARELHRQKKISQPLEKSSLGSVFKSENVSAAKLIDESGLKGLRVGGAIVSHRHAGFIINDGGASCEDVLRLIEKIKREILFRYNVELQEEIKIIPERISKE